MFCIHFVSLMFACLFRVIRLWFETLHKRLIALMKASVHEQTFVFDRRRSALCWYCLSSVNDFDILPWCYDQFQITSIQRKHFTMFFRKWLIQFAASNCFSVTVLQMCSFLKIQFTYLLIISIQQNSFLSVKEFYYTVLSNIWA